MIGIVLAGGASNRFGGAPKGLQLLNGKPMALHVAEALRGTCASVAIEAKLGADYEQLGLPICSAADEHAGKGPIAGMIAGLKYVAAQGADAAAFAACDMPFLTIAHYQRLFAALDDALAAYAITPDGAEPLAAIVRIEALPALEEALAAEKVARAHVILDLAGAIGAWFSDPAPFRSINTPEELDKASSV